MPDPVVDALRRVANERTLSSWEVLGDRTTGEPPTVAYRRAGSAGSAGR